MASSFSNDFDRFMHRSRMSFIDLDDLDRITNHLLCHEVGRCVFCLANPAQLPSKGYCTECETRDIPSRPSAVFQKCVLCNRFHAHATTFQQAQADRTSEAIMAMLERNSAEIVTVTNGDDGCPVCYDHSILAGDLIKTTCGHQFCKPCIQKWLDANYRTCPMCRDNLCK